MTTNRKPPVKYTQALMERICELLVTGRSLRSICADPGMPDKTTVLRWCSKYPQAEGRYTMARQMQAECFADEIIEIADKATAKNYNAKRLQVDSRKWVAANLLPKKYGHKTEGEAAAVGGTLKVVVEYVAQPVPKGVADGG